VDDGFVSPNWLDGLKLGHRSLWVTAHEAKHFNQRWRLEVGPQRVYLRDHRLSTTKSGRQALGGAESSTAGCHE
jgi:hypothetical protein